MLLISLWLRRLGVDLLMSGRLVSCIPMARAFLESSESEDERDYEVKGEEEESELADQIGLFTIRE